MAMETDYLEEGDIRKAGCEAVSWIELVQ